MRSPALAIAWEFRRRHLWVLIALAGYLLALAAIKFLIPGPGEPVTLDPPDGRVGVAMVPLSTTFFYFLAVYSSGLTGDLAGRQSIYPARMFALPVTTKALAGWPMLYGAATMASLWLGTALFARWPWEIHLPLIWPALLAVVFLAWTQALTWMPYGLPGLRVIVTVLWLPTLDAVALLAIHYKVREPMMVAFLAPQLPLAYFTACSAVARARRGDVPDWRGTFAQLGQIADVLKHRRDHFSSPARAQAWLEWRRHGRSLPALVGLLLPFELALLWLAKDAPAFVFEILFLVLITPPFMAAFTGWTGSKPHPNAGDSYGVPPFSATRPLTSSELIAAKLKMAMWSTLAAWLLVLVAMPPALEWSGTWSVVTERARQMNDAIGTPRAATVVLLILAGFIVARMSSTTVAARGVPMATVVLLILAGFIVATWKQLVQSLHIGLTG